MSTTLLKEVFGVRKLLGDPLDQAPSTRQIISELELEYQQLLNEAENHGLAQHVGELVITTVPDQRRYELGVEATMFYKALGITTIPETATVSGSDYYNKRVTVTTGDDRESSLEFTELERFGDEWPNLAAARGQLFASTHDSQAVAMYKTLVPGLGEKVTLEFRPTPGRAQSYMLLYQLTDWWDQVFNTAPLSTSTFKLPHSSQRALIRCRVAMNLLDSGAVKWALNDQYNATRTVEQSARLEKRLERYTETYEEYLDTLEHGDVVYVDLWADKNYLG